MTKLYFLSLFALSLLIMSTAFKPAEITTSLQSVPEMTCPQDTALTNVVIATDVSIAVSSQIFSTQSILESSNVTYKSGSGTTLAYGTMTGSLSGPSQGFQIFKGSSLTILVENCS